MYHFTSLSQTCGTGIKSSFAHCSVVNTWRMIFLSLPRVFPFAVRISGELSQISMETAINRKSMSEQLLLISSKS